MRLRCYLLTINNPEETLDPAAWGEHVRCAVWQLEMGDEGTPHYQIYVEFTAKVSLTAIHEMDGLERCAAFARKGTRAQAIEYCSKDDTRLEGPFWHPSREDVWGASKQGDRTDIHALTVRVTAGDTDAMLAESMPVMIVKHQRGIDALRTALSNNKGRNCDQIDVVVYVGPSGTGKSYRLRQECPEGPDWYWKSKGEWWDGYQGQLGVVFDEFRDNWMPRNVLLSILDGAPQRIQKKGGVIQLMATRFRFSTNIKPKNWYREMPGKVEWSLDALRLRLPVIRLMLQPHSRNAWKEYIDESQAWDDGLDHVPLRSDDQGTLWNGRDYEKPAKKKKSRKK